MPLYVFNCAECETEEEVIRPAARIDDECLCEFCDMPMARAVTKANLAGIIFSNPLTIGSVTFESNAQKRAYEEKNNVQPVSSQDVGVKTLNWNIQERADKYAQKLGHTDAEAFSNHAKSKSEAVGRKEAARDKARARS